MFIHAYNNVEEIRVLLNKNENINSSILVSDDVFKNVLVQFSQFISEDGFINFEQDDSSDLEMTSFVLILESVVFNNFISSLGRKNILVIPSENNHSFLVSNRSTGHISKGNISAHSFAVINKYFNCNPNVFVAYPENHSSTIKSLLKGFNVNIINSNKMYSMGDETYEISVPDELKFDAVLLVNIDIDDGVSFTSTELKNDFSKYCSSDFDLIDYFCYDDNNLRIRNGQEPSNYKLRIFGEQKRIDDIADFINTNSIKLAPSYNDPHNVFKNGSKSFINETKVY